MRSWKLPTASPHENRLDGRDHDRRRHHDAAVHGQQEDQGRIDRHRAEDPLGRREAGHEISNAGPSKILETYELNPENHQLNVTLAFEGSKDYTRSPIHRIYDVRNPRRPEPHALRLPLDRARSGVQSRTAHSNKCSDFDHQATRRSPRLSIRPRSPSLARRTILTKSAGGRCTTCHGSVCRPCLSHQPES